MPRLNLVLTPKSPMINDALIALSQRLFESEDIDHYQLAKKLSIPHISIAQVEVSEEISYKTQQHLLHLASKLQRALSVALQAQLFTKDGGWSELRLNEPSREAIQLLHDAVCHDLGRCGIKLSNAHGERFVPHFTLAKLSESTKGQTIELPLSDTLSKSFECVVSVGRADEFWQLVEIFTIEEPTPAQTSSQVELVDDTPRP